MERRVVVHRPGRRGGSMNPWVDVFGWSLVLGCLVALRYEIPRAAREMRRILDEERELQEHIARTRAGPGGRS